MKNTNPKEKEFIEIVNIIQKAKEKALISVNKELIELYWQVGKYISNKVKRTKWGKSIVSELADYISKKEPEIKGFSSSNIWRMKQFYETYSKIPKLATLLRELNWSNHLLIISRTKSIEEREFYINLSIKERYSFRELERQINSCYFERTMLSTQKLPSVMRGLEQKSKISSQFKDTYFLDFLDLPKNFSEKDLQSALVNNFKDFILELGKDFAFIGQEYRIQIGNNDYFIDLLFYHRSLQCLVAFELKIEDFKPEFLGKLNFYLEALDRNIKKEHENPSVGVILCKNKDKEVAEYSLSRNLSPALISEYKTKLIDKKILKRKFKELYNFSKKN